MVQSMRLNAPFGARCFLTWPPTAWRATTSLRSLNAPFGARCFLTKLIDRLEKENSNAVLMHLLALGAF